MKFIMTRSINKEFILFILTGGFSAIINLTSRIIISNFLRFEISVLIAYLIGMITAYYLAKKYVFLNIKKSYKKSFPIFALVNLVAVLQTFFISKYIRLFLINISNNFMIIDFISHLCGVIFPIFSSFFGHKYITFRNSKK